MIATRPYSGNARILPIDIYDPTLVFYAPLWHPSMMGSPIYSYDINHHTGTVVGAVWGPTGRISAGGDDYISFGTSAILKPTAAVWVEAWVYLDAVGTAVIQSIAGPFNSAMTGEVSYGLWENGAGKLAFYYSQLGSITESITSDASVSATTWHYVAGGYDCATTTQYVVVDGTVKTGAGSYTALHQSTQNFYIGCQGDVTDGRRRFLNGIIGEVGVLSRVRIGLGAESVREATKWRY